MSLYLPVLLTAPFDKHYPSAGSVWQPHWYDVGKVPFRA